MRKGAVMGFRSLLFGTGLGVAFLAVGVLAQTIWASVMAACLTFIALLIKDGQVEAGQ